MSEKYRPSNGDEGEGFWDRFCLRCERDRAFLEGDGCDPGCEILARTMIYDVDEEDYPSEWTYGADGKPTCTAFLPLGSKLPTDADLEAAGQARLPL